MTAGLLSWLCLFLVFSLPDKLRKLKIDVSIYLPLPNSLFIIILSFHAVLSMQLVINYQANQQTITILNLKVLVWWILSLSFYWILFATKFSETGVHFEFTLSLWDISQLSVGTAGHVSQSIMIEELNRGVRYVCTFGTIDKEYTILFLLKAHKSLGSRLWACELDWTGFWACFLWWLYWYIFFITSTKFLQCLNIDAYRLLAQFSAIRSESSKR